MSKPGDLFLGVFEFFGVLVPGVVLLALAMVGTRGYRIEQGFEVELLEGTASWIAFLIAAFVLGHVVQWVASLLLDKPLYKSLYLKRMPVRDEYDGLHELATRLRNEMLGDDRDVISTDWWANDYVRVHSGSAMALVDRLLAEAKFFRSLSLAFVVGFVFVGPPLLFWLLVPFSLLRFCERRQKATMWTYQFFILLAHPGAKERI